MPTTLTVSGIRSGFSWDASKTNNTGVNTTNSGSFAYSKSFSNGSDKTVANTIGKFYVTEELIAASGNLSIDVSGSGASLLKDPFGGDVILSNIRYIFIELVANDVEAEQSTGVVVDLGTTGNSIFGVAISSSGATTALSIQRGGNFQFCCGTGTGYLVPGVDGNSGTANTADIIKITNSSSTSGARVRVCVAGH